MKIRRQLDISGSVQGLGVRPYVYNLATELGLQGSVMNTSGGLTIDIQGEDSVIEEFSRLLDLRKPPLVEFRSSKTSERSVDENLKEFVIAPSAVGEVLTSHLLADLATCSKCEVEILIHASADTAIPLLIAPIVGPDTRSLRICPMTGLKPPWLVFLCVSPAKGNTKTRQIVAFMLSPLPVPNVVPSCSCGPLMLRF